MSLTNFAESLIDLFRLRVLTPLLPEAAESSIPAAKFKNQPHKIHSNSLPSEMIVSLKFFSFFEIFRDRHCFVCRQFSFVVGLVKKNRLPVKTHQFLDAILVLKVIICEIVDFRDGNIFSKMINFGF